MRKYAANAGIKWSGPNLVIIETMFQMVYFLVCLRDSFFHDIHYEGSCPSASCLDSSPNAP